MRIWMYGDLFSEIRLGSNKDRRQGDNIKTRNRIGRLDDFHIK